MNYRNQILNFKSLFNSNVIFFSFLFLFVLPTTEKVKIKIVTKVVEVKNGIAHSEWQFSSNCLSTIAGTGVVAGVIAGIVTGVVAGTRVVAGVVAGTRIVAGVVVLRDIEGSLLIL